MKTYKHNGWYGEDCSYVFESLTDFDEYEQLIGADNINTYNPNFWSFKDDFKAYIGKIWKHDEDTYKIIAIEDDNANMDWYWVVQNTDDDRDIKYELANDSDFYKNII